MTWKAAWSTFLDNPIVGVGPDGFYAPIGKERAENAHNDILQVISTMGIVGLFAYLAFLVYLLKDLAGPSLGAITALFINAKFSPVPLEALILACVIIGGVKKPASWPVKSSLCALSVVCLLIAGPISLADYYAQKGNLASIQRACEINPSELAYKTRFINLGAYEYNRSRFMEVKAVILKAMKEQGMQAIDLRPNSDIAQKIYAVTRSL